MELGRNVTLGQYVPGESFIHRLDPRTKTIGWAVLAALMFMTKSFTGLSLFLVLLLIMILSAQLNLPYVLGGLKPMLPLLSILYVFQVLFSGSLYPDAVNVVWEWGMFRVTLEGMYLSGIVSSRVILLYLSVTILTLTTSLVDLTDGTERMLSPFQRFGVPANELAMVAAISVRFVPTLIEEQEKIIKAQMARGAKLDVQNAIARTKALIPILVPLFLNTLRRAEELSTAMEARCYRGGKGRTKRRQLRMSAVDFQAVLLLLLIGAAAISLRLLTLP
jgi:energy-coupling factor transport system permease protein